MGRTYDGIDGRLLEFIRRQHVFFVATAPSGTGGHVNVSPKGLDSFRVLGDDAVAWLDLTGSGVETIAHLRDNGRITIMFCAFEGPPRIVRLHGRGQVHPVGTPEFDELAPLFPEYPGRRSVIRVAVERISDSCGYGVPEYQFVGERTQLPKWAENKGDDGIPAYWAEKNAESIDGLAGLGGI